MSESQSIHFTSANWGVSSASCLYSLQPHPLWEYDTTKTNYT